MTGQAELGHPAARREKSPIFNQVTSVLESGPVCTEDWNSDEEVLISLGYRPEFKREFGLWSTFCVSFAVLGLLPSFASTLYYGLGYAGTPGMTWGYLIAIFFIQCVAFSMAELCSSMPTSGGLYYAAAVLAPPGYGPLASWLTGWSNWLGLITCAPSVNYAGSAMILAAASIANPGYVPRTYQVWVLTVSLLLIHACFGSLPTKWLAKINSVGSTLNLIAIIAVIIIIPAQTTREDQGLSRFAPSDEVWGRFYDGTSFSNGLSLLMSFISVIWTMSGFDAPFHLSEECSNSNIASPRAIVLSSGIGGILGWFLQLVVAYTVIDIDGVLGSELGQPWASYLLQVMPQKTALVILALTIMCSFSMGQGCMVASSRVTFAYARDDCLPFSSWIKRVNRYTKTPVNAVWFNNAIGIALTLLIFAGPVPAGALFSIGAVAAFVAFTIPIFIRVFFVGNRFRPGPWNLGRFSRPIGWVACAFVALMVPILMLPTSTVTSTPALRASTMNWTCLVYGGPMLVIIIWWFISAHKWFKGPKINLDHRIYDRDQINHAGPSFENGNENGNEVHNEIQIDNEPQNPNENIDQSRSQSQSQSQSSSSLARGKRREGR